MLTIWRSLTCHWLYAALAKMAGAAWVASGEIPNGKSVPNCGFASPKATDATIRPPTTIDLRSCIIST